MIWPLNPKVIWSPLKKRYPKVWYTWRTGAKRAGSEVEESEQTNWKQSLNRNWDLGYEVEVWGARLCVSLNYNCTHTSAGRYGIHEIQIQTLWDARRSLLIHFIKGVEKVAGQTNGYGIFGWFGVRGLVSEYTQSSRSWPQRRPTELGSSLRTFEDLQELQTFPPRRPSSSLCSPLLY